MKRENELLKRSWRKTSLWKKAFVCSALLLLVAVNVQAAVADKVYPHKDVGISTEAVAVQLNTDYKWVHSGRELFFTKISGQTHFVGIQAMMRVPYKIEIGEYYAIPLYFTRFEPILASLKPIEQLIINSDTVQKIPYLPIDVFICAGIGVRSSKISTDSYSKRDYLHIGIGICDGNLWTYNIPISPVEPVTGSKQYVYTVYDQKIWINQPGYRYLSDIPVGSWDGPYVITVKIEKMSCLPPSIVVPSKEEVPIPVTPVEYQSVEKGVKIAEEAMQKLSNIDVNELIEKLSNFAEESKLKFIKNIELKEVDGKKVYQLKGSREAKLFWFLPVEMEVTFSMDIDTGAIKNIEAPWWSFLTT